MFCLRRSEEKSMKRKKGEGEMSAKTGDESKKGHNWMGKGRTRKRLPINFFFIYLFLPNSERRAGN